MNKGGQKPRAILVFGVPMSGKSAFAEHFSEQFHAPHFDITSLEHDHNIPRKTILVVIKEIAKCKQAIILEGGISTEADRNEIRDLMKEAGYLTSLIWVQTDLTTIKKRLKTKFGDRAKAIFEEETAKLEAPSEAEHPIVVSGKHTFESQLRTVLANLSKHDPTR